MKEQLYYSDSYCTEFTSEITSCTAEADGFRVSLEPCGFYPGGGGAPADKGTIAGHPILSADEHSCTFVIGEALEVGAKVECRVDWDFRLDYMRQHTAEHIVSGLLHTMTGGDNVGFHMSDDTVTVDWSVELTQEQLLECENRANAAAMRNLPVTATIYPEAPDIPYRSKREIADEIRLVTIEGIDVCACCAMHVARTGEVGMIRITDSMRWKGGTRLTMLAGDRALRDAQTVAAQNRSVGQMVSAKPYETAAAVRAALDAAESVKASNTALRKRINELRAETLKNIPGAILLFEDDLSPEELRHLTLRLTEDRPDRVAVFTGSDDAGYRYAIASTSIDVRALTKALNAACNGRGGGTAALTQGSVKGTREEIERQFAIGNL